MLISRAVPKALRNIKYVIIILFALCVARQGPHMQYIIDALSLKSGSVLGGQTNIYIVYAFLAIFPIAPFILLRMKPVTLIAVIIALFPFMARLTNVLGIYGFTTFYGIPRLISGLPLFVPFIFAYLFLRYRPVNYHRQGGGLLKENIFLVYTLGANRRCMPY